MIFLFKKSSLSIFLLSKMVYIFGWKVIVITSQKSYFLRKISNTSFYDVFADKVQYAHFSAISDIKDANEGDYRKISDGCVEQLYQNIDKPNFLSDFYFNIEGLSKKIRILVIKYFDCGFYEQKLIIQWLENSIYNGSVVVNFCPIKFGMKCVWKHSNLRVIFILNYLYLFINIFSRVLTIATRQTVKRVFAFIQKEKIIVNIATQSTDSDNHQYDVIFFPHCGIFSPPKDYFYSDQIDSPFHPSNIMHFEYDSRSDVVQEAEKMKKHFNVDSISYKEIVLGGVDWRSTLKLFVKLFANIKLSNSGNVASNVMYIFIVLIGYVKFTQYRGAMNQHKNAKIALIGYDTLFPCELSLALESFKVKTVAIQDRFDPIMRNITSYILDSQLTVSDFTSKILDSSNRFAVKNILPVGQVRSDHFFDKDLPCKTKYKLRVIVLDFHIMNDVEDEKFDLILNWKNDINFRNEIILIAEAYPDVEFIFRGKNCNWYYNEYHNQIISKVNDLPNVVVDCNYSIDVWRSYHLCASADLIIARPTSLAEECASKGMDIIVSDYGVNYTTDVSRFLPKLLKKYYCHSFEQLKEMFDHWIKYRYVVSDELKNRIKSEIFSNLTDGQVKKRTQDYLHAIYATPIEDEYNNNLE